MGIFFSTSWRKLPKSFLQYIHKRWSEFLGFGWFCKSRNFRDLDFTDLFSGSWKLGGLTRHRFGGAYQLLSYSDADRFLGVEFSEFRGGWMALSLHYQTRSNVLALSPINLSPPNHSYSLIVFSEHSRQTKSSSKCFPNLPAVIPESFSRSAQETTFISRPAKYVF